MSLNKPVDIATNYIEKKGATAVKEIKQNIELTRKIEEYWDRQYDYISCGSYNGALDFEGLGKYIKGDFINDAKNSLLNFNNQKENINNIYVHAYSSSKAKTDEDKSIVKKILDDGINIINKYYHDSMDDKDKYLNTSVKSELAKYNEDIKNTIKNQSKSSINNECAEIINKKYIDSRFKTIKNMVKKNYIKNRFKNEKWDEIKRNNYAKLFSFIIDIKNDTKSISIENDIFTDVEDIIYNQSKSELIKISGTDGMGKSTFLSLLYLDLITKFENNGNIYPFYINFHYYDTCKSQHDFEEKLNFDIRLFLEIAEEYDDLKYILIIDGIEKYFRTELKVGEFLNLFINKIKNKVKIVCVGEKSNSLLNNIREQAIPYVSRMKYIISFHPVVLDDKSNSFIDIFCDIEDINDNSRIQIKKYIGHFDINEIDLHTLCMFKECFTHDMLDNQDSISQLYKKYCLAYLQDEKMLKEAQEIAFDYYLTKREFGQEFIANKYKQWNLVHQHKNISNFLIASEYVFKLRTFKPESDMSYLFNSDRNLFIKELINNDAQLFYERCKSLYKIDDVMAKSQAIYMLGRLKLRNNIIAKDLNSYYKELMNQLEADEREGDEYKIWNDHFLIRTVIVSLVNLGITEKWDDYLHLLLTHPYANELNRGFHLDYYGDIPRDPANSDLNYRDNGTAPIDATYRHLMRRINENINGNTDDTAHQLPIYLFTLCSLIQIRLEKQKCKKEYIEALKNVIDSVLEENLIIIGNEFTTYLLMLKEDIKNKTFHSRDIYDKLYGLKDVKRKGWLTEIKNIYEKNIEIENDAEHIYYTWLLGMLFLPDNNPGGREYVGYDKHKILELVLIHDWAEVDVGDVVPSEDSGLHREKENQRMLMLLMHDTYMGIASMAEQKELWSQFGENSPDINGRLAYELDKIQAIYQFHNYLKQGAVFSNNKIQEWKEERKKIKTSVGQEILKKLCI